MGSGEFSRAHRKLINQTITTYLSVNCYLIKDISRKYTLQENHLNPLHSSIWSQIMHKYTRTHT